MNPMKKWMACLLAAIMLFAVSASAPAHRRKNSALGY